MKSTLFASALPAGKEWVKVDINKAGKNLGFNFKALMAPDARRRAAAARSAPGSP